MSTLLAVALAAFVITAVILWAYLPGLFASLTRENPAHAPVCCAVHKCAIRQLTIKPGDIVVLETDERISETQRQAISDCVKEWLPDVKVGLLTHGLKIVVLTPKETQ